ncbi:MAG: hydrolase Nlp/P60 [Bacteroidetes bacterium SW_9_63_38]|nr:MAG: hydrolase Nlp/P60 [Bacteroidetes bacterium SW_9_63_38]
MSAHLHVRSPLVGVSLLCLVGLMGSGCTSSQPTAQDAPSASDTEARTWSPSEAESRLRSAAQRWGNTPHELGGESQSGADCSGLVQSVFSNQFEVTVPRTTEQQVQVGRQVSQSELQPGDLVFFRPGYKKRHVGIYLSDGEFLHASASSGVTVSPLDRSYWQDRWWQGRRVLSLTATDAEASSAPAPPPPSRNATW